MIGEGRSYTDITRRAAYYFELTPGIHTVKIMATTPDLTIQNVQVIRTFIENGGFENPELTTVVLTVVPPSWTQPNSLPAKIEMVDGASLGGNGVLLYESQLVRITSNAKLTQSFILPEDGEYTLRVYVYRNANIASSSVTYTVNGGTESSPLTSSKQAGDLFEFTITGNAGTNTVVINNNLNLGGFNGPFVDDISVHDHTGMK